MASSLFGSPAKPSQQPQNNGGGSIMQMVRQFNDFKKSLSGKDPKQIVQGMLASGQMSRNQFEQLSEMAKGLEAILK